MDFSAMNNIVCISWVYEVFKLKSENIEQKKLNIYKRNTWLSLKSLNSQMDNVEAAIAVFLKYCSTYLLSYFNFL